MRYMLGLLLGQASQVGASATQPSGGAPTFHPGNPLVPLALALAVVLVTVEMIRRRKLREEYALLWLVTSLALLVVAVFPNMVIWLATTLHINYLTIVVLGLFLFLAMIVLHLSMVVSRQSEEIRQLAQRIALLDNKLGQAGSKSPTREGMVSEERGGASDE